MSTARVTNKCRSDRRLRHGVGQSGRETGRLVERDTHGGGWLGRYGRGLREGVHARVGEKG
jgi:hypothetical protein